MTRVRLLVSALALLLGLPTFALADQLITDLSDHQVSIRSNFTGTEILIFGAVEARDPDAPVSNRDVVVVVTGPEGPVTVRRKQRVAGVWINYDAVTFERAPSFYAVLSTRPLARVASMDTRTVEGIGLSQINFGAAFGSGPTGAISELTADERQEFSTALIETKERQGLYRNEPGGVAFLGRSLFRATIDIPSNVPNGLYTAKVFLIESGQVRDVVSTPLYVVKSGIERAIYNFAHGQPLLYGIFAVVLATFAGWTATLIFKD